MNVPHSIRLSHLGRNNQLHMCSVTNIIQRNQPASRYRRTMIYKHIALSEKSGNRRRSNSKIETLFSVEQDLKFLLPGLKVKGTFSFDRFSSGTVSRGKTPDYYVPATGRDDDRFAFFIDTELVVI